MGVGELVYPLALKSMKVVVVSAAEESWTVLEMCPKTNHMMILYGHFIS